MLMALSFITFASLLSSALSQCHWTVRNPYDGSLVSLNLTALQGVTLKLNDTAQYHYYYYSICGNKESCKSEYVMTKEAPVNDPSTCYILGRWDSTKEPAYDNINGGTWTFEYNNGDDDCGNPARTWSPMFVCAPGVKYQVGYVDEIPNSCFYEVVIKTQFACLGWTTTTTSIPDECIFKSENGNHTLNMASIRGKLLTEADEDKPDLYYMYTPCTNSAKCNNNTSVMAYIFDGMNFECKQYLAIWEDGYIEPNYIEGVGIWQFTYTNGQPCNGGQTVFNVEWICDKTASAPRVIQAKKIATCVYQMVINSTLACD